MLHSICQIFYTSGIGVQYGNKFRQNTFNQHILQTHKHTHLPAHMHMQKAADYLDMFHARMIILHASSFQYIIQPSTRPCCITNSCWSPGESFHWLHLHSLHYMSHWYQFSNFNQATPLIDRSIENFICFQGNI